MGHKVHVLIFPWSVPSLTSLRSSWCPERLAQCEPHTGQGHVEGARPTWGGGRGRLSSSCGKGVEGKPGIGAPLTWGGSSSLLFNLTGTRGNQQGHCKVGPPNARVYYCAVEGLALEVLRVGSEPYCSGAPAPGPRGLHRAATSPASHRCVHMTQRPAFPLLLDIPRKLLQEHGG